MSELINRVRQFKQFFEQEKIFNFKGFSFNQRELIDYLEKTWKSQYLLGDKDDEGYRYFYNIVKFPVKIAAKMIDLDTKDIRIIAEEGQSYTPVYLFNKELKSWMKDQNLGLILNEVIRGTPKFGNQVLKVKGSNLSSVRLKNLINDPYVKNLNESAVVIEEHYMTPEDLMKQTIWNQDLIDEIIESFQEQSNKSYIKIDEVYLYAPKKFFKENSQDESLVRGMIIVAGLDDYKLDKNKKNEFSVIKDNHKILFKEQVDKLPYYEFYWDDYEGTWLRTGIVMELLEEQFRTNETVNLQAKGLYWTTKKIYQTRDMMIHKNLMTDVQNGEILRVNSEITPVANEERNLAAFNTEINLWDKNRKEKTMTFESVTGETLPSGTPFRLGFILQQAAGGHFNFKREDIGLMIKRLLREVIIPEFKESKRGAHLFNLYGEDNEFSQLEELWIEMEIYKQVRNMIERGFIPTQEQIDLERENAKKKLAAKKTKVIEIPEGFYDDLKYKIDIIITGESVAIDAKMQSLITTLQTIATNPAVLQNEVTKNILFKILNLAGISPEELRIPTKIETEATPQQTFSPPPSPKGLSPQLQNITKELSL